MPKMNGLELLDKLKADSETKEILIVLLTNLGIQEELDKAIRKGAITYIIKSAHHPNNVFNMVKDMLSKRLLKIQEAVQ